MPEPEISKIGSSGKSATLIIVFFIDRAGPLMVAFCVTTFKLIKIVKLIQEVPLMTILFYNNFELKPFLWVGSGFRLHYSRLNIFKRNWFIC